MGYFPNGTSGDVYMETWCFRCVNWHESSPGADDWGCLIWDLHLLWNYDQQDEPTKAQALSQFIPLDKKKENAQCRMFILRATADCIGQYKMEF